MVLSTSVSMHGDESRNDTQTHIITCTTRNAHNTLSGVAPGEDKFRAIDLGEVALRSSSDLDTNAYGIYKKKPVARILSGKPVVARGVIGRRWLIFFLFYSILHHKPYVTGAAAAPPLRLYRDRTHRPPITPDNQRPPPPHPPPRSSRRPLSVLAQVSRRAYVNHHRRTHGAAVIEHRRCRSPRMAHLFKEETNMCKRVSAGCMVD